MKDPGEGSFTRSLLKYYTRGAPGYNPTNQGANSVDWLDHRLCFEGFDWLYFLWSKHFSSAMVSLQRGFPNRRRVLAWSWAHKSLELVRSFYWSLTRPVRKRRSTPLDIQLNVYRRTTTAEQSSTRWSRNKLGLPGREISAETVHASTMRTTV